MQSIRSEIRHKFTITPTFHSQKTTECLSLGQVLHIDCSAAVVGHAELEAVMLIGWTGPVARGLNVEAGPAALVAHEKVPWDDDAVELEAETFA